MLLQMIWFSVTGTLQVWRFATIQSALMVCVCVCGGVRARACMCVFLCRLVTHTRLSGRLWMGTTFPTRPWERHGGRGCDKWSGCTMSFLWSENQLSLPVVIRLIPTMSNACDKSACFCQTLRPKLVLSHYGDKGNLLEFYFSFQALYLVPIIY